jgi:hypothetical protein
MKRNKFINWIKYKLWVWEFNNNVEVCPICGDKLIEHFGHSCYKYTCSNERCDFNKMK